MITQIETTLVNKDVKIAYEYFDDIDEVVRTNRSRVHLRQDDHTQDREVDRNFTLCNTYGEAEELALNGWKELENILYKT